MFHVRIFREFFDGLTVPRVSQFWGGVEAGFAGVEADGGDQELLTVGGDRQGCCGVDLKEIDDWAINHKCQTVAVLR